MKSSPGTIVVTSGGESGGGCTRNYTTIVHQSSSQQQQQQQFLSEGIHHQMQSVEVGSGVMFQQSREMMIINCNDSMVGPQSQHQSPQNNTPDGNRMTMSVSLTPVQSQHQPSNSSTPGNGATTTILLPIQMTSTASPATSGVGYFEQQDDQAISTSGSNSCNNNNNQAAIEKIIILNAAPGSEHQYQSLQQGGNTHNTPVIELGSVGGGGIGQGYERIIMISPSTSTSKLEASSVKTNAGQPTSASTIISLVSTNKDHQQQQHLQQVTEMVFEEVVMGEDSGSGSDGKITTTTTREGHGLKDGVGTGCQDELEPGADNVEDDDADDVFKFVLDEVAGPPEMPTTTSTTTPTTGSAVPSARQLRSSGAKDPMMGSGGMEILMMEDGPGGTAKKNADSQSVVVLEVGAGVVVGEGGSEQENRKTDPNDGKWILLIN